MLHQKYWSIIEKLIQGFSEFSGTAILVFLGCLGCRPDNSIEHIALTFGLGLMAAVQAFGHISGGHFNPAVSIAAAIVGKITLTQTPFYFVGQFIGAFAGYGLVLAVNPHNSTDNLCTPVHNEQITEVQTLTVEFLLTLILVWVCCGIWDTRNNDKYDSVSIRLGLTIAALVLAGAYYSGANVNPVRSFAPSLVNNYWTDHWVYWIGPIAAGFLGGLTYKIIFSKTFSVAESEVVESSPTNYKPNAE